MKPTDEQIEKAAQALNDGMYVVPQSWHYEDARAALTAAGVKPRVKPGVIEALRSYGQADMDGIMCIVSRQAVEEAIDALSALTTEGE